MSQLKCVMVMVVGMGLCMVYLIEYWFKFFVEVVGCVLIDYVIECLVDVGVEKIVINVYYKVELLIEYFVGWSEVEFIIFDECGEFFEMGGGIVKVFYYFQDRFFFVYNSDFVWIELGVFNFKCMVKEWDDM